jgi:NAD(P)-dependent dehydrogenase (short-subunit alcohol dehydrogenase family)
MSPVLTIGASHGIGLQFARQCAATGADVKQAERVVPPLPLGEGRGEGSRSTAVFSGVPLTPTLSPEGRGRKK